MLYIENNLKTKKIVHTHARTRFCTLFQCLMARNERYIIVQTVTEIKYTYVYTLYFQKRNGYNVTIYHLPTK